jgi:hypothetical protein
MSGGNPLIIILQGILYWGLLLCLVLFGVDI